MSGLFLLLAALLPLVSPPPYLFVRPVFPARGPQPPNADFTPFSHQVTTCVTSPRPLDSLQAPLHPPPVSLHNLVVTVRARSTAPSGPPCCPVITYPPPCWPLLFPLFVGFWLFLASVPPFRSSRKVFSESRPLVSGRFPSAPGIFFLPVCLFFLLFFFIFIFF